MDASVPDHNYGRRFSQADGSHKKKKKGAPKRMSSFSSEGGNSFQGILDDDTEIDHFELRASASRRSSTAENTPGGGGLSRYGLPMMADVGLDASVQVDGHMGRRSQEDYYQDYYDYPQKDSSKNKSRWMMLVFVLVQGILLVALLATLEHATQQKKDAPEQAANATAALRGNPEPPAVDLEGEGEEEDSNDYLVAEEDEEEELEEEEEEELDDEEEEEEEDESEEEDDADDDDIDLQAIFAEAEDEDAQAEQIALDEAANAPTTAQREAYLMEADALERLETTEELEARAWADLEENTDLDSDEESDLETKAETLGQLEDNLSQQADLLDQAGQTAKKEERHAIAKKVKALQKEEKELEQKTIIDNEEESNADLEDGS